MLILRKTSYFTTLSILRNLKIWRLTKENLNSDKHSTSLWLFFSTFIYLLNTNVLFIAFLFQHQDIIVRHCEPRLQFS